MCVLFKRKQPWYHAVTGTNIPDAIIPQHSIQRRNYHQHNLAYGTGADAFIGSVEYLASAPVRTTVQNIRSFEDGDKVFKTTCFLSDMGDFAAFNEVYAKYFTSNPTRSCVAVKTLPKNALCEIEAVAEA